MIADKTLCLAHEHDRQIRNPTTPPAFCPRYIDCERHQRINHTERGVTYTVKTRVCLPGRTDAFINIDAPPTESEGGEA